MVQKSVLLGNRTAIRIVAFFAEEPSRKAYVEEIRKGLGMAKATIIKGLKQLEGMGVVKCKREANAKYCRLNTSNPMTKRLLILLLLEELVPLFKGFDGEVYLYGSLARGEASQESDVDLLVVTKKTKKEAYKELSKISKATKRKLSLTVVTPIELAKIAKHSKTFYKNVTEDRIRICG